MVSALRKVQAEHSAAVESGEIARAFRANVRFHQTLFQACGNPYLADAINAYAFKSHGIRSYSAASPPLLRKARDEHLRMEELVALCIGHLQPPLSAYVEAYEQLFGLAVLRRA